MLFMTLTKVEKFLFRVILVIGNNYNIAKHCYTTHPVDKAKMGEGRYGVGLDKRFVFFPNLFKHFHYLQKI